MVLYGTLYLFLLEIRTPVNSGTGACKDGKGRARAGRDLEEYVTPTPWQDV